MEYDLESKMIAEALRRAGEQRDYQIDPKRLSQAAGGRVVPLTGGELALAAATPFLGRLNERSAMRRYEAMQNAQRNEYDQLLGELTTPGTKRGKILQKTLQQLPEGQEGPPEQVQTQVEGDVPLSPEEESRRRLGVYGRMSRLPMAKTLMEAGIKSEVDMPEKVAMRNMQTAAMQEAQERRALDQKERDARIAEDRRLYQERQIEATKSEKERDRALRQTLAAMSRNQPSITFVNTVDESGNPVLRAVDKRAVAPGTEFGKPAGKPSSAQVKQDAVNAAPDRIDAITKEAEKNEKAFGIVPAAASMLPNIVGSRIVSSTLNKEQRVARNKVMAQAAEVIHDLYGAALSRNEAARADAWAVNPTDDYDTVMSKLQMAKEWANMRRVKPSGGQASPKPAAGGVVNFEDL